MERLRAPSLGLDEEGIAEPDRHLPAAFGKLPKRGGRWEVRVLGDIFEVVPVERVVEEVGGEILGRRAGGDELRRELQPPRLMDHRVDDDAFSHASPPPGAPRQSRRGEAAGRSPSPKRKLAQWSARAAACPRPGAASA